MTTRNARAFSPVPFFLDRHTCARGKTLCSLFPEKGGFTVLLVLGKEESEKVLQMRDELSSKIQHLLGSAEQLHDGRWLWVRLVEAMDTEDIK